MIRIAFKDMKIKKQFTALIIFISLIPILCVSYIFFRQYLISSDRYLTEGYQIIKRLDKNKFSSNDIDSIESLFKDLQRDVQSLLIDTDGSIIYSTMPYYTLESKVTNLELINFITNSSSKYFYQITSPNLERKGTVLVTRTLRKEKPFFVRNILQLSVLVLFIVLIIAALILIYFISKNISASIVKIEKVSQELSEGNLEKPVFSGSKRELLHFNEITSILDCLEKMRLSLLEGQERKNKFLMGISHDLRTPVSIIKGYIEALKDGVINDVEEIKETLSLVTAKTNQLESMIDNLISYMKLNTSELRAGLTMNSITELLKSFAKESEIMGNVFKRNIICNIDIQRDIKVPMNIDLARRALENLFQNALRYTKDNDTIEMISYLENSNVMLIVRDTGIGISEKDLKHIFDLFYRATNSRREEGMGLGLSVVKDIIETHNWKINVISEIDVGSSFILTIPYDESKQY